MLRIKPLISFLGSVVLLSGSLWLSSCQSCSSDGQTDGASGPELGTVGKGPQIDKSGDVQLHTLIRENVHKFHQLQFRDTVNGCSMKYNLFTPEIKNGEKYPLVIFMADGSTTGQNVLSPLIQGYGGLVWVTDDWQKDHPSFVLVPQFSGIAVDNKFRHTPEVETLLRLIESLSGKNPVDRNRLYTAGQSMGGMIAMYFDVTYPDMIAASMYVDSYWDTKIFDTLVHSKFIYVTAGAKGKSWANIIPLEKAAKKKDMTVGFDTWSARLPEEQQNDLAIELLEKGRSMNVINFSPKSVLPEGKDGDEHVYCYDYAFKIPALREWIFRQERGKGVRPL